MPPPTVLTSVTQPDMLVQDHFLVTVQESLCVCVRVCVSVICTTVCVWACLETIHGVSMCLNEHLCVGAFIHNR